ncbi:MAG: 16S rRNA (cytosine(1402)-N(4))-methyltransferase RsmH [Hyphomicrobiales bacterium]|nr:16S rRNA (cytosine(1402)-N(4))-methyltransferase RsmH [Hyphomicrobiales bacterium]
MTGGGKGEVPETAGGPAHHTPVLVFEVLSALQPIDGELYIDCTFGAGGYSRAIVESAKCRLLALDRDPSSIPVAAALAQEFPGRFHFAATPFSAMEDISTDNDFNPVDAVIFDLGVSSMQLDQAERGFSFMRDGPLDMRMSGEGVSAGDVVNGFGEAEIADILFHLGEERRSRAVAKAITARRAEKPFDSTLDLARLIESVMPRRHDDKIHPATRSFQALRLFVNNELGEIAEALCAAERILKPGGRLIVVTFHSLEDRIVKTFLAARSGGKGRGSRHMPDAGDERRPSFALLRRKPVEPGAEEVRANPRARSAKLRAGIRLDAPAWSDDDGLQDLPGLKLINLRR